MVSPVFSVWNWWIGSRRLASIISLHGHQTDFDFQCAGKNEHKQSKSWRSIPSAVMVNDRSLLEYIALGNLLVDSHLLSFHVSLKFCSDAPIRLSMVAQCLDIKGRCHHYARDHGCTCKLTIMVVTLLAKIAVTWKLFQDIVAKRG